MASSDLNKVMLIGRLGADPEGRQMPSGEQVVNFSVATSERWKDKGTGEQKEVTEWHRIVIYGGLAKVCMDYLRKGSQVYLEGKNRTRKWTDKNQIERYTTEIICNEMKMLGSRGEGATAEKPRSARPTGPAPGPETGTSNDKDDFDDDIPF